MRQNPTHSRWLDFLIIFLIPIVGLALGVAVTLLLKVDQESYLSNFIVNLFFLAACVGFLFVSKKFSPEDLGLKVVKEKLPWHVVASLVVFGFYMLFYIFVIRISGLRPISSNTAWGLLTYLIVALVEELYYRGLVYRFFEKSISTKAALILSSLFFGLFHLRQGWKSFLLRATTGWLFGSVRYSSGMIFLLIFPIHFAYDAVWLLFDGNWNNPPAWAAYAIPALEIVIGLIIVTVHDKRAGSNR